VLLGIIVILIPWVLFPVCGIEKGAFLVGNLPGYHGCHGTLKAVTALGGVAVLAGIVPLLLPRRQAVFASSVVSLLIAALVILFPSVITGICSMPTMPCRLGTLPALVTAGIIMGIAGITGIFISKRI